MEQHAGDAPATRHAVAVDLRDDWAAALSAAGFSADRPTAWLAEGILYSLDEPAADRLLATVTRLSAPGSTLAFDHFEVGPSLRTAASAVDPTFTGLWQPGPADPGAWLERHGWRPDVRELAEVAARFGRAVHPAYASRPGAEGRSWLATAALPGTAG
ncbi:SAM-dependent methyltransferase [Streptomyces sp. TS71-3]|uniref:SAM-dependent methyltransferase n=1 Tax=Streptomyces sp. TS71-3 TaxID=2733862 RepID=UPI001B28DEA6|nr:SAM-dependent methyltransferase [Streptomyces sp. TS71-3]GHJ35579.1 hypothetical protein Sm713_11880 [Streptomyces sp. TS71-3]